MNKGSLKDQLQNGVLSGLLMLPEPRGQKTFPVTGLSKVKSKFVISVPPAIKAADAGVSHWHTQQMSPSVVSPRVPMGTAIPVIAPELDRIPSLQTTTPISCGTPVPLSKEQAQRKKEMDALERDERG